jgi:hypothetical protein
MTLTLDTRLQTNPHVIVTEGTDAAGCVTSTASGTCARSSPSASP